MKRLLLTFLSVMAFAGMGVAQDIYSAGYFRDENDIQQAAVYKNEVLIHYTTFTSGYFGESTDVDVYDEDVYWVRNAFQSSNFLYADVMKNDAIYLDSPTGQGRHIFSLYRLPNDGLYSVGCMNINAVRTAVVWRDNDPDVFFQLGDATWPSLAFEATSDVDSHLYTCGLQYGYEETSYHGVIWKDNSVYYTFPDGTKILDITYYRGNLYSVGKVREGYEDKIKVWKEDTPIYTFNTTILDDASIDIDDAGDIYVAGLDGSGNSKVWKNGIEYFSIPGYTASVSVLANYNGVYASQTGSNCKIWKDGEVIYWLNCEAIYKFFIEEPTCTNNEVRTLPYFEGFETGNTDWACWTKRDLDDDNGVYDSYWHRGGENISIDFSSNNCAWHGYNGVNDQHGQLLSPDIRIPAGSHAKLTFQTYEEYAWDYGYEGVWIHHDNHNTATRVWHPSENEVSAEWKTIEIDLSDYSGQDISVEFCYFGLNSHNWYIDNVSVTEEAVPQYTITANANNNAWGTVSGGGTYNAGETCTLTATPASGYEFLKWTKNGAEVSSDLSYSFTVTENASYTAVFGEPSVTYYTIATNVSPAGAGTVEGAGVYPQGATTYLTATPNLGWTFSHWNDGVTTNPRSITVNGDATYTANFLQQNYTLTVNANPAEGGTVTGGGSFHYGDVATLTATASSGFTFVSWSDGNTNATRTVTVTGNPTYTAIFNANGSTMYTVTVVSENPLLGSVSGGGTYPEGTVIQISATPSLHGRFVSWDDGNTDNPRDVTVTGNMTFKAKFDALQQYTITVESADPTMGTATGGGTFVEGTTITISASAFSGYYFTSWDDGNADNPRSITVTQNATYKAQFSDNAVVTYNLTVMCNPAEGSVIGNGTYAAGTTVTIAAIPNSGFEFDRWNDDSPLNPREVTVNDNMVFVAFFKGTAVDENEGNLIVLYPNPANDYIRILGIEANSTIEIYNSLGERVRTVNASPDQEIGVSDLASGIYLVRCGSKTLRFVKKL